MTTEEVKEEPAPPSLESHRRSGSWLDVVKSWASGDLHSSGSKGRLDTCHAENDALELLKEQIKQAGSEYGSWLESSSENHLRRILRSRRLEVSKAFTCWEQMAKWRSEYKPQELTAADAEWYLSQKVLVPNGADRRGRPSTYIHGKLHAANAARKADMMKAIVYTYESGVNESPDGYCSIIFDTEGCGYRNMDSKLWTGKDGIIHILQDFYPETLAGCVIINASWFFKLMWKFLKPFLDDVTVAKVKVLDSPEELLEYYDYDNLAEPLQAQIKRP